MQALIILAAAITSAIYMILQKHYLGHYSALEFTAYLIWSGTLLMLPFGEPPRRMTLRARRWRPPAAVIYLGSFLGRSPMWDGRM